MKNHVKKNPLKAKDLVARFNKDDPLATQKIIYPEVAHIHKISSTSDANETVQFFDGNKLIFVVNKKNLKAAIDLGMNTHFGSKGIKWQIPLYKYAVDIFYNVEHQLKAVGNYEGIILWIDGKALG